ncbi:uncharacterized protein N7479_007262 [Penicillium vulpinum]|uniref:uncharacterized protein n=1 Tax=Penicillium vulpinum TaxID=29845 RepID=UPI0025481ADA|nr:uncharacterized protein N7479_007262 [Penicillium vulpinum]KAJ5960112.1 hypothetical protein N7479_007262 [Penicillium vulpinum]
MAHSDPITLYTCATPNGFKISITLEELGLSYNARPINLVSMSRKKSMIATIRYIQLCQAHHFAGFAPVRSDWVIQRYVDETKRLYMVLNTRLGESPYVAGEKFTIADIASFCWVRASPNLLDFNLDDWPAIRKWYDSIMERDTVQKALNIPTPAMIEAQFAAIVAGKRKEMLERKNADSK